jgi:hypothetical protein
VLKINVNNYYITKDYKQIYYKFKLEDGVISIEKIDEKNKNPKNAFEPNPKDKKNSQPIRELFFIFPPVSPDSSIINDMIFLKSNLDEEIEKHNDLIRGEKYKMNTTLIYQLMYTATAATAGEGKTPKYIATFENITNPSKSQNSYDVHSPQSNPSDTLH